MSEHWPEEQTGEEQTSDDTLELLHALGALREEVQTMGTEMQEVVRQNRALQNELDRLRGGKRKRRPSDMRRMKQDCLDGLERLREVASHTRRHSSDSSDSWMKRMMMFMMISEMV